MSISRAAREYPIFSFLWWKDMEVRLIPKEDVGANINGRIGPLNHKLLEIRVVNAGNVELDVGIYDKGTLTGNIVLGPDESEEVSGTKFIGEQNEQEV